jgi:hypothetical protein
MVDKFYEPAMASYYGHGHLQASQPGDRRLKPGPPEIVSDVGWVCLCELDNVFSRVLSFKAATRRPTPKTANRDQALNPLDVSPALSGENALCRLPPEPQPVVGRDSE